MCGIGGTFGWFGADGFDPVRTAAELSAALAHRGPDGEGTLIDEGLLLVHRRLAIIDPSPAGRQPMTTADGRHTIVFNGEIYNYRALRAELEAMGARFQTASDTEVLLALVACGGVAALAHARGMFALALWDRSERSLTLARDRFGVKPLYVAAGPRRVSFASEIGALRRASLVDRDVAPAGVLAYLAWGYVPSPLTWLRGVECLPPGCWRRWRSDGRCEGGTFAEAIGPDDPGAPATEADLRARTADALRDTVAAHMVADVPVGIFLSGGIDSAALVATARAVTPGELHTYTVAGDVPAMSELAEARQIATLFETNHHELMIGASAVARALPSLVGQLDSPTADAVNSYFVSQAVARTRVKAVLSGVGGDEMFGGYPSFRRVPSALTAASWLGPVLPVAALGASLLSDWRARKWQHFAGSPGPLGAYRAVRGLFMPEEWRALVGPAFDGQIGREARETLAQVEADMFRASTGELPTATVARMEIKGYLGGQLLRDVDIVSMAHGLEVRVPFVDDRLRAAVWPSLGHHPHLQQGKRLLHESVSRPLPADVVGRPKRGFTLPFDEWMRDGLRDPTRHGLQAAIAGGWVNERAAVEVWNAWDRGRAHWSRAWALSVLGQFLVGAP